jgi:outer membrane protein assembly factor BamB
MRARAAIALLATLLLATSAAGKPAPRGFANDGEWLSYGHDDRLTNAVVSPTLRPTTVPNLREQWWAELDGLVVASPLFADGVVYAATEGGSAYALDGADGHVLWRQQTGTASECGITFGISSTGAIDAERRVLYAIGADGELHAFDLASGAEAAGFPIPVVASPSTQYVWGGLRIVGHMLYVPFASYCDELTADDRLADGGIVGVDLDDPTSRIVFDAVPGDGNGGGVWGYGGVSVEPDGSFLYAGIGNAHVFDPLCGCDRDDVPFGDRLVKLTPSLEVVDSDYPPGINPQGDQDFGSAPLLFQPRGCPPLAAANSKNGLLYVWKRGDLAAGPIAHLDVSDAVAAFVGQPSWSSRLQMLFDAEAHVPRTGEKTGDGVVAVKTGFKTCRFREAWRTPIGIGNQAPPLVVGDVVFAGGGRGGGLYALDGETGAVLWTQATDGARTFSPLIEARKRLFAPVGAGIRAYAVEAGSRAAPRHQLGSHTRANGT